MIAISVSTENQLTLSTTHPGAKSIPGSYFPYPKDPDLYYPTMFAESTKTTANTAPTNLIQASQYVGSGVYNLTVLNEASGLTVSTEVTTHYNYYTTTTVPSAVGTTSVDQQQMTTAQYKVITRSKTVPSTSAMRMYTSREPYPAVTEQGTADPQLSTTAQKSCQAVVMLREAVAWALFSLMTLLFIGMLSLNVIILCIQKHRQKQDNTARATTYEMDGNPCYESSKIDNTGTY